MWITYIFVLIWKLWIFKDNFSGLWVFNDIGKTVLRLKKWLLNVLRLGFRLGHWEVWKCTSLSTFLSIHDNFRKSMVERGASLYLIQRQKKLLPQNNEQFKILEAKNSLIFFIFSPQKCRTMIFFPNQLNYSSIRSHT